MKRFVQLMMVAASLALGVGVVAAQGGTRPDDRTNHGVGSIGAAGSSGVGVVRPDDRATHGPGALSADTVTQPVRPDDRAWRGIGPAPSSAVSDTPTSRDGFDWADAGFGALAAFGLGLLLVGVSVVVLRRQRVASFS
jgi:hypothetical protein